MKLHENKTRDRDLDEAFRINGLARNERKGLHRGELHVSRLFCVSNREGGERAALLLGDGPCAALC